MTPGTLMKGVTSLMPGSEADSLALIWLYVTKWPCLLRRHGSGPCRGVAFSVDWKISSYVQHTI